MDFLWLVWAIAILAAVAIGAYLLTKFRKKVITDGTLSGTARRSKNKGRRP